MQRIRPAVRVSRLRAGRGRPSLPFASRSSTSATRAQTATSACGHSCTSSTRISIVFRSKRAIAPRELSHSSCRMPSGSCGAISAYSGSRMRPLIVGRREDRLRDHAAGRQRNPAAILPIDVQPRVQQAREPALEDRRAGGSAGKIGSSTRMAACSRANSASSAKGRFKWTAADWPSRGRGNRRCD